MSERPVRVLELRSVRGTGGGPEKTILFGAAQADPSRYAVTVCYVRDRRDTTFGIDLRAGSLPIAYTEISERHSLDPSIWPQLRRLVRDRRIDIVHAHEYKTDLLAWMLARAEPIVPLATAHGWTGRSWRERHVYYPADRRLLARFPRVVAVSGTVRDDLVAAGVSPARITVVPNGIDHRAFRPHPELAADVRAELGLTPGDVVVGAVGRLELQKNFALLLRVFRRVVAGQPRLRLVIAGDGSLRAPLERMAVELGLGARCRFTGHVRDVGRLHAAFDLFVQSSDYEGTPNAVLEAMACGTPVVATDAGGTAELARPDREALIVPVGDEAALAGAVREALADPGGRTLRAARARQRVAGELSFEARMRRIERLYDQLLARQPGDESRPAAGGRHCA